MPERGAAARAGRERLVVLLLPALLLLGVHLRSVDYDFVWTDRSEIVEGGLLLPPGELHEALTRPRVADATGASWAYYRPLQVVLVNLLHHGFGETPRAYRLTSLLLGSMTMSLFAWLVLQWRGRPGEALFAGALPALHPAGLEVYVWIAGISASMVALLLIAGLGCGVAWLRGGGSRLLLPGCAACYLLALLSKESAVILPALLLAVVAGDALAGRTPRGRSLRMAGLELSLPGLALVAAFSLVALLHIGVLRPWALGATTSATAIAGSRSVHLLTALASWPASLGWMLLPLQSTTSDVVPIVDRLLDWRPWLGAALLGGSALCWALLARAGRTTAALGLAWIWIAFLPTANLLPTLHARADRNVFLSSFGLALVLVELAPALLARVGAPRAVAAALAGVALLGLGQRTWARAPYWQSTVTLFERDVARDPDYREGRYWLAGTLLLDGRVDDAIAHLEVLLTQVPHLPERPGEPRRTSYLGGDAWLLYCQALLLSEPARVAPFVQELARTRPKRAAAAGIRSCLASATDGSERVAP